MTIETLARQYVTQRHQRGEFSDLTATENRYTLGWFADFLGGRQPHQIGERDVERWLESMHQLAATTRYRRFSTVRTFLRWLVRRGHLRRDPTVDIPSPKLPRRRPRARARDEIARLIDACPDSRARLIVTLMVQQCLRRGEVAALDIGDIDLHGEYLRVVGKGAHERVLPITEETSEALAAYLAECPTSSGPLIRSRRNPTRGISAKTIGRYVSEWMYDAGVKRMPRDGVSAHALRHTGATDVLERGADLRALQEILGHATLNTVMIYTQVRPGRLIEAMEGRRYGREPAAQLRLSA